MTARLDALRARLDEPLLVTNRVNIAYLTGFESSNAALLVEHGKQAKLFTDFRYMLGAEQVPGVKAELAKRSLMTDLAGRLSGRIGFEADAVSFAQAQELGSKGLELVPTTGIVERARVRKDRYERDTLTKAAAMLAGVVPDIISKVRPGRSETDIAFAIDTEIHRAGFERTAFDTIVAGGPNGALPHAHPGERTVREGDLVVLDFGGVYDSYCVDLTRTVSVGTADSRAREVYGAVLTAHDLAIRAVRPGESRFAVDGAARDELTRRGFGEAFGHGTGHGLGIDVHEDPRIGQRRPDAESSDEMLSPDMVFTIEPGVYLPEWGGVRIEDDVLVTQDGVRVLTEAATELIEI